MRKLLLALVMAFPLLQTTAAAQQKTIDGAEELPVPKRDAVLPVPEALPVPQPLAQPVTVLRIPQFDYPRPGRKSVWRLYEVDTTGTYQPRVVYSPYGAYYQHNGAPYPWTSTRPGNFSNRFIVD